MPNSLVIQNLNTKQFLHVVGGNIPTSKQDCEWLMDPNKATHFPGQCYVDYALKQVDKIFGNNLLVNSKPTC